MGVKGYKYAGKSIYQIAKELGVKNKKKREIVPDQTSTQIESLIKAIEPTIKEDKGKELEWYKKTDLQALRVSWGYTSTEIANKLGISISNYSNMENKVTKNPTQLDVVYKFFQDERNINFVNGKIPEVSLKLCVTHNSNKAKKGITKRKSKEIIDFFINDLEGKLKSLDVDRKVLAKELGVDNTYFSWCIHHAKEFTRITDKMVRVYNYFKDIPIEEDMDIKTKPETIESIETEITKQLNDKTEIKNGIPPYQYSFPLYTDPERIKVEAQTGPSLVDLINDTNKYYNQVDNNDSVNHQVIDPNDSINYHQAIDPNDSINIKQEPFKVEPVEVKPVATFTYNEPSLADLLDEKKTMEEILLTSANNISKVDSQDGLDLEVKKLEALKGIAEALKELKGDK